MENTCIVIETPDTRFNIFVLVDEKFCSDQLKCH